MLRRVARAAALDARIYLQSPRTALAIPIRSRTLTTATAPVGEKSTASSKPSSASLASQSSAATVAASSSPLSSTSSSQTSASDITQVHPSIPALLPHLLAQPPFYARIHIHARPYLITEGDTVRLPFWMHGVSPGDVLRLNRASVIGSRDYTLKGGPFVDEKLFECRATVIGTESEPLRLKVKTKQRNRRTKTVKSKHKFTILKISELKIRGFETDGPEQQ